MTYNYPRPQLIQKSSWSWSSTVCRHVTAGACWAKMWTMASAAVPPTRMDSCHLALLVQWCLGGGAGGRWIKSERGRVPFCFRAFFERYQLRARSCDPSWETGRSGSERNVSSRFCITSRPLQSSSAKIKIPSFRPQHTSYMYIPERPCRPG